MCNLARVKALYDPVAAAVYRKQHYEKTGEAQRERSRQWHAANRERRSLSRKLRRQSSDNVRAVERRRDAERRATDLDFRIKKALRARITSAIKRGTKTGSAISDLGCTIEFFKEHIAAKFRPGMTWANWPDAWQLDHIKPLAQFDLTVREEFLAACHYSNFQPLGVIEHRAKTAKESACSRA